MKTQNRFGFMLVELIIAMGIMTIGFLALLGTIPASMSSVGNSRDLFYMTNIAKEKIEFVRGKSFTSSLTSGESSGNITVSSVVNGENVYTTYHYNISVYPYKNGVAQSSLSASSSKIVVVTVYDYNRAYRSIKMETNIARQQ